MFAFHPGRRDSTKADSGLSLAFSCKTMTQIILRNPCILGEVKLLKAQLEAGREMHQINLLSCKGKTKNLLWSWQSENASME